MVKKALTAFFAGLGMLMLILDSKTALSGGIAGVDVCVRTVIPSLFPFFVLTILLTGTLSGLQMKLLRPIGRLCKMPDGSEPLLLLGLLGGYPAGAQAIAQTYAAGQLSRKDAQRLLGFCNNAGPSFLFGIAALSFPSPWMPWALWGIHMLSAILTGFLLPGKPCSNVHKSSTGCISLSQAMERAIRVMAKVCSWIILFRIVLAFCDRWFLWYFPVAVRAILVGILELANGCLQLGNISSVSLRFCVCSAILSLGGISVTMQTLSVTGSLGMGQYLPGKLIQCVLSILFSLLIFFPRYIPIAALLIPLLLFLPKIKNNSRKTEKVIV